MWRRSVPVAWRADSPDDLAAPAAGGRAAFGLSVAGVAVASALAVVGPITAETGTGASPAAAPFVVRAIAVTAEDTSLLDRPEDGSPLRAVPVGTQVEVGGAIRTGVFLWGAEMLWVRVPGEPPGQLGFLQADAASVVAGTAPDLDVGESDIPRLLAASAPPAPPVGGSAGGLSSEPFGGAAAELAAAVPATDASVGVASGPGGPGVSAAGAAPAPGARPAGSGVVAIPWLPDTVARWAPDIVAAADRHGIDPELLAIITVVESGGGPRAGSSAGARGLTQVMPATGAGIAAERGIAGFSADDLWDPATALDFGAYYLAQQLAAFGRADDPDWLRSVELAAAAYNGGPGSARRWLAGGALPAETTRYVDWVGNMWRERREAASPTYEAWLAAGGSVLVDAARRSAVGAGG